VRECLTVVVFRKTFSRHAAEAFRTRNAMYTLFTDIIIIITFIVSFNRIRNETVRVLAV